MSPLSAWVNFYVIVGSSAGALTGLTFVVITLIGNDNRRGASGATSAFTTPTIVHFGTVLVLAAVLSAPWPTILPLSLLLVAIGVGMLIYASIVVRRLRRQDPETYLPVLEDWLWYGVFPLIAYIGLVIAAVFLANHPVPALFGIAGVLLLLLINGLHNAWDLATYLAIERFHQPENQPESASMPGAHAE